MTRIQLSTLALTFGLFAACGGEDASEVERGLAPDGLDEAVEEPYCGPRPHPLPWTEAEELERLRRCP